MNFTRDYHPYKMHKFSDGYSFSPAKFLQSNMLNADSETPADSSTPPHAHASSSTSTVTRRTQTLFRISLGAHAPVHLKGRFALQSHLSPHLRKALVFFSICLAILYVVGSRSPYARTLVLRVEYAKDTNLKGANNPMVKLRPEIASAFVGLESDANEFYVASRKLDLATLRAEVL